MSSSNSNIVFSGNINSSLIEIEGEFQNRSAVWGWDGTSDYGNTQSTPNFMLKKRK